MGLAVRPNLSLCAAHPSRAGPMASLRRRRGYPGGIIFRSVPRHKMPFSPPGRRRRPCRRSIVSAPPLRSRGAKAAAPPGPSRSPARSRPRQAGSPRCSSIIAPTRSGRPDWRCPGRRCPGAEPWTGSNREGQVPSGLMLPRRRDADRAGAGGARGRRGCRRTGWRPPRRRNGPG